MRPTLFVSFLLAVSCAKPDVGPGDECGGAQPACTPPLVCDPVIGKCVLGTVHGIDAGAQPPDAAVAPPDAPATTADGGSRPDADDADHAPPDTTILDGPRGDLDSDEATYHFACDDAPCAFACALDGGAFTACASGILLSGLAPGPHTFRVRAADAAGNVDPVPAEAAFTVRLVSPRTVLLGRPADLTRDATARFTLACFDGEAPATCAFTCALDGAAAQPCSSPHVVEGLAEGAHRLTVAGTLADGRAAAPAGDEWVVDRTGPTVELVAGPRAAEVTGQAVDFRYLAGEPGAIFRCGLDGADDPCPAAGRAYPALTGGAHTFAVHAIDAAGNAGPPASVTFVVDREGPAVTVMAPRVASGPSGTLLFAWSDLSPPVTFTCDLGQGTFACQPGEPYVGLPTGPAHAVIHAVDARGNASDTAWDLVIDATPPVVKITGLADGEVVCAPLAATLESDDAVRYRCAVDLGDYQDCQPAFTRDGLAGGPHTLRVIGVDAAGNASAPVSVAFVIDAVAPVATITSPAAGTVTCGSGSIAFTAGDALARKGDMPVLADCVIAAPAGPDVPCVVAGQAASYAGLTTPASGSYTVRLRVRDACGNVSEPATRQLDVDTVKPTVTVTAPAHACASGTIGWSALDAAPATGGALTLVDAAVDGVPGLAFTGLSGDDDPHQAVVRVADACGNVGQGTASFAVDTTGPSIVVNGVGDGPTDSGKATLRFAPSDATTVEGGVSLGDGLLVPSCTCDPGGCGCTGLAAGSNRLAVRGRDACGNEGPPTTTTVVASYAPQRGHVVLIGEDAASAPATMLGNAAALAPFIHHGLDIGRATPRVLVWRPAAIGAAEASSLTAAIAARLPGFDASDPAQLREFSTPADLATLLPGRDVLFLHDPKLVSDGALDTIAAAWAGPLRAFTEAGGVVVALGSPRLLGGGGAPLLAVGATTSQPAGTAALSAYPADLLGTAPFFLAAGVGDEYATASSSRCFHEVDPLAAILYELQSSTCADDSCVYQLCPTVLDKVMPEEAIDVDVPPWPGSIRQACEPPIVPRGTPIDGTFTPSAGDHVCFYGIEAGQDVSGRPFEACAITGTGTFELPAIRPPYGYGRLNASVVRVVDGEPQRIVRAPFVVDGTSRIVLEDAHDFSATARALELAPVLDASCDIGVYQPFESVTCELYKTVFVEKGPPRWSLLASRSDEGCGAIADARGGFQSDVSMTVDWTGVTPDTSGGFMVGFRVRDFYGNLAGAFGQYCVPTGSSCTLAGE